MKSEIIELHGVVFPGAKKRIWAWAKLHEICWICGNDWGLQSHHIQRQGMCYRNWGDVECNLFRVCPNCHEVADAMPYADQLAYKLAHDQETFNLGAWRHCLDGPIIRSAERVTMREIADATERLAL
jgi:hypothetical protein